MEVGVQVVGAGLTRGVGGIGGCILRWREGKETEMWREEGRLVLVGRVGESRFLREACVRRDNEEPHR